LQHRRIDRERRRPGLGALARVCIGEGDSGGVGIGGKSVRVCIYREGTVVPGEDATPEVKEGLSHGGMPDIE
jgi:hypothetical protein